MNVNLLHGYKVAVVTCIWFGLANIVDLLFGILYYRKYLGLLTAYFHHSVFIWMMYCGTTGNTGLGKTTVFAPAFEFMLIEEIPTFLLALGSVFPQFRTDLGFGITFFLLRICYHAYFLAYTYYSGTDGLVIFLFSLTMVMHLNWFYTWVTKYGKAFLKKPSQQKQD